MALWFNVCSLGQGVQWQDHRSQTCFRWFLVAADSKWKEEFRQLKNKVDQCKAVSVSCRWTWIANMISLHRVEFCMTVSTLEAVCILPLGSIVDILGVDGWGKLRKSYWIYLAFEVGNDGSIHRCSNTLHQPFWHQAQLPASGKHDLEAYKDHQAFTWFPLCTMVETGSTMGTPFSEGVGEGTSPARRIDV